MELSNPSLASERFKRGKSIENKEMMEEETEEVGKGDSLVCSCNIN